MRGVRKHAYLNGSASRIHCCDEAIVIGNVAREDLVPTSDVSPFDLGDQNRQGLAEYGCKNRKPPTVHPPNHNFCLTRGRSLAQTLPQNERRRFGPLDAKALL